MFQTSVRADVELRILEERHAPTVFALVDRDREYLRKWLPWVDATHAQGDTVSFIRSSLERFAANHGFAAGIWNHDQFVGVIGTHQVDWLNRKVEIGYWVGQSFQGKGIVTDACRIVVTHLFKELDLNRVEIHCAVKNGKSAAIPKRLGFTLEGTLREGILVQGGFHDALVFGMLKREWGG